VGILPIKVSCLLRQKNRYVWAGVGSKNSNGVTEFQKRRCWTLSAIAVTAACSLMQLL